MTENWVDMVVERMKKDGDYVLVTRCRDCVKHEVDDYGYWCNEWKRPTSEEGFCHLARMVTDV